MGRASGDESHPKAGILNGLLRRGMAKASRISLSNVLHRIERGLRPALGCALIMTLTMCDIPHMDYSFKYVGPFLFLVISSLAPPFVSTSVLLLTSGLFCVLLAAALATGLIACLLLDTGAQLVCIVGYVLSLTWVSFLSFGRTKELTLIGSYILLYTVPLATLLASRYALNGLTVTLTTEKLAWIRNYLDTHSQDELISDLSHFLLVDAEAVRSILSYLASTEFKLKIYEVLKGVVEDILFDMHVDPLHTLKKMMEILHSLQQHKAVDIQFYIGKDTFLPSHNQWLYGVPFFIQSSGEQCLTIGAKKGRWIIEALWSSSPLIGLLRNIVIFAALGYAIYILVSFIPPIRRQRDVAIRDMAHACAVLSKHLCSLAGAIKHKSSLPHTEESTAPSKIFELSEGPGLQIPLQASGVKIQESVLKLVCDSKAVLLSAMEPSVISPGLGVFASKELEYARVGLLQCCWMVQCLQRNLERDGNGEAFNKLATQVAEVHELCTRSGRLFELSKDLLVAYPSIWDRTGRDRKVRALVDEVQTAEQNLEELATLILSRCSMCTKTPPDDTASNSYAPKSCEMQRNGSCRDAFDITRNDGILENPCGDHQSIPALVDATEKLCLMPTGQPSSLSSDLSVIQASVLLVNTLCVGPLAFSRRVRGFHVARTRSTWRGFLMNLVFPLAPLAIHIKRLTVAPLEAILLWRHKWTGIHAWWRDPEAWYAVKLIVLMSCIFACGICCPQFLDYSWGVNVTDRPIILDATDQGVATRMVPWFMLGYLTVFQVTCNGTVFRALNRLLGILFGSLSGWLAMEICGGSLAALITYCSATIFLDTCFLCNSHHPLEGFHLRWGYAGQVFTYTQVLIVCLAYEDQGGMTGQPKYLAVTRILSNFLGIILAILVSHIPPLCSATWSAYRKYREVLSLCSSSLRASGLYLVAVCNSYKAVNSVSLQISPSRPRLTSAVSSRPEGCVEQIFYDSAVRALSDIDTTGKDNMAAAFRYIREGFFIPRPLPWRTDEVLEDFHCIIGLVLASTRDVLLCIRELGREAISQETSETELVDVGCRQMDNGELKRDKVTFKEYMSAEPVVEDQTLSEGFHAMWFRGDKRAGLRDLFIHPAGAELAESVQKLIEASCIYFEAFGVDMCSVSHKSAKRNRLEMTSYAAQRDSVAPSEVYERARMDARREREKVDAVVLKHLEGFSTVNSRIQNGVTTLVALLVMLDLLRENLEDLHTATKRRCV